MRLFLPNCHGDEHQSQHRENKCLNKSDKYFQKKKRQGDEIGHQESNNDQQYFARKDISKKAERERYNFNEF